MKTVPAALTTAIKTAHNLNVRPRLTVEWNLNRYHDVTADNIPVEDLYGYDDEYFPVESIVEANRPTKGIAKGRISEMVFTSAKPAKQNVRFYLADPDDAYRYWTSPVPTNGSGVFPVYNQAFATPYEETDAGDGQSVVRPHILYDEAVKANKIIIKTENSWATANAYTVFVRTAVDGAWVSAGSSGLDNATGQITLWWNGTSWVTTKPTGALLSTDVAGVMLRVDSLTSGRDLEGNVTTYIKNGTVYNTDGQNAYFSLIEIAACLEADLTSKLISVDDTFDMAEKSLVYPMGTVTANVADITLSNLYTDAEFGIGTGVDEQTGLFNKDNPESPFRYLAEANAIFNLEYIYSVAGTDYPVQQFRMYSGPWSITADETVNISLRDYSKFFDEQKPKSVFWENKPVAEIVWRLCDQLGFVDYKVGLGDAASSPNVSFFWTDGEKTMWEILNELSVGTQTAIYFDSWGVLQIRSRDHAFDAAATPAFTLRANNSGAELANIISLDATGEPQTNHVTVNYYTSNLTDWNRGNPTMSRVWEPEGNEVVRATVLLQTITPTSEFIVINQKEAEFWHYTGIVQIEGELIRYEGKQYAYWHEGELKHKVVKSREEHQKYRDMTLPSDRYRNKFTGKLKISERGIWNSEEKNHAVEALGYNVRRIVNGNRTTNSGGFSHHPNRSLVSLRAGDKMTGASDMLIATRGNEVDSTFFYYGTRLRFVASGRKHQRAGLVFNNNGNDEDGYYVELASSDKINRKNRHELILYSRKGGVDKEIGKGRAVATRPNKWYDIDVSIEVQPDGDHRIQVAIHGWVVMDKTIDTNKQTLGGKFGMFIRGDSEAEFEYLYAVRQPPGEAIEETSFWDWVEDGYMGRQWDAEWVYRWKKTTRRVRKKSGKKKKRFNRLFMDEFGPWVHEVREYEVKFDPAPVLHTKFLLSNEAALCTEFRASSFGANFIVANAARRNVVIHGEDTLANPGAGEPRNAVMLVLGRIVEVADVQTVVRKNEQQVKVKGKIETEINSQWIQSKDAAEALGDWIKDHWSEGVDEANVAVFGNPLIEVGDVVSIDYPDRHMAPDTHKYFVVSTSNTFAAGIETTLLLRRVT